MTLPGYDTWLSTDRAAEAAGDEWDAYVEWCDAQGFVTSDDDDPATDPGWQEHLAELEAAWLASMPDEPDPCEECDWVGAHGEGCALDPGEES